MTANCRAVRRAARDGAARDQPACSATCRRRVLSAARRARGSPRRFEEEGIDPGVEARAVAAKRARQLAGLPVPVRKRRLLAFLVRRGYGGPQLRELVEELCG